MYSVLPEVDIHTYFVDDFNERVGEEGELDEDLVVLLAVLELEPRHALHQLLKVRLAQLLPVLHSVNGEHAPRLGAALGVGNAEK